MSWKKVSEITQLESPLNGTRKGDLHPDLFTALKHAKQVLQARRNLAVAERRAHRSASKLGMDHVYDYMDKKTRMETAHEEWAKAYGESPDETNTQTDLWEQTVLF